MKNWKTANTGNHQALVVEEKTGRNVAVVYDKADADLIAAAPDLLKASQEIHEIYLTTTVADFTGENFAFFFTRWHNYNKKLAAIISPLTGWRSYETIIKANKKKTKKASSGSPVT